MWIRKYFTSKVGHCLRRKFAWIVFIWSSFALISYVQFMWKWNRQKPSNAFKQSTQKLPFNHNGIVNLTESIDSVDEEDTPSVEALALLEPYNQVHEQVKNILGLINKGYDITLGKPIPASKAKHILIITSWRSGSSFFSDILDHYPGTWYSFEPLHYIW